MAEPNDSSVRYGTDLLDGADPRAQAFAEQDAARNSIDEVLDNWVQRVSPHSSPDKMGESLPGDDDAVLQDKSAENILGCPTIMKDGKVYLQGYVSNAPESVGAPAGVQSVEDIEQVGVGVGKGLAHAGGEYLEFLSQPNAVNNAIEHSIETASGAIYHYGMQPGEIIPDAQRASERAGQVLVDKLGHPLTPEQTGEMAGEMMTVFIPVGRARALTDGEIEALGGTQKLEAMSAAQLKELGLKRPTKIGPWTGADTEESVVVKTCDYLLNPLHKDGWGKEKFLREVLGFNRENMEELVKQLKYDPDKAVFHEATPNGPKYLQTIRIAGVNGETRDLPFVWIHNPDGVTRLVTIPEIPDKPRL